LWFVGNYLVTIEHLHSQHHASLRDNIPSVRVYANLHPDVVDRPISASIAGQIRSMRLDEQVADSGGCDRLNVIEIPLKALPLSVAVNSSTGNFAIGLQTRVLIYALNSKSVTGSRRIFRLF